MEMVFSVSDGIHLGRRRRKQYFEIFCYHRARRRDGGGRCEIGRSEGASYYGNFSKQAIKTSFSSRSVCPRDLKRIGCGSPWRLARFRAATDLQRRRPRLPEQTTGRRHYEYRRETDFGRGARSRSGPETRSNPRLSNTNGGASPPALSKHCMRSGSVRSDHSQRRKAETIPPVPTLSLPPPLTDLFFFRHQKATA